MTRYWAGRIRPLALCVFRRDDGAILVARGFDERKNETFYRPLGGEIEFGERAEDAARREVREETGSEVDVDGLLGVTENLFTYRGEPGHELVWLFEGRLSDESLYSQDVVRCDEGGYSFEACWMPLEAFERGEAPLYPDGLLALLTASARSQYDVGSME